MSDPREAPVPVSIAAWTFLNEEVPEIMASLGNIYTSVAQDMIAVGYAITDAAKVVREWRMSMSGPNRT